MERKDFNEKMSKLMNNAWMLSRVRKFNMSESMRLAWKVYALKQKGLTGEVAFDYIKKSTGELRHAVGTFDFSKMPANAIPGKGHTNYTDMQIRYFDTEKQAWRSCLMSNIVAVY